MNVRHTATSRPRSIALLVAAAMFMNLLDGTVITTALPAMSRSFGTSAVNLNVAITVYFVALAVFMPASAWLGERFGAKRVFITAIAVFSVASLVCASSTSFAAFVAARVVQAVGAAMMQPVGRLVVLRTTPKAQLMNAMSMMTWPALVAPIVGPPIGGYLTTYLGWPWIFLLNVPLGVAAIVATFALFPADGPAQRHPFDGVGFAAIGAGSFGILYGLDSIGKPAASGVLTGALLTLGGASLVFAVHHLRTSPHPLVHLGALRFRTFAVSQLGGSLSRLAIGGVPFLLPLMFQLAFGLSAAAAGVLMFWLFVANLAAKTITTPTLRRFGFRGVLIWNGVLTALSIIACAAFSPTTPPAVLAIVLFVGGAARSMQFTAFSSIAFADVPGDLMASANTLSSMMMQVSAGLGVAVGTLALRLGTALEGGGGPGAPSLAAFHLAFVCIAAISLLGVADALRLPADAGRKLSHPEPVAARAS